MEPPSLPGDVKSRAFVASNGELGICFGDFHSFLTACRGDHIEVLGWELWIVDHTWPKDGGWPVRAVGLWCGGIPIRSEPVLAFIGGEGDAEAAQQQLASIDIENDVDPNWHPYLRVNFTLGDSLLG